MLIRFLLGMALYCIALLTAGLAHAAPVVLEPSSPWNLDYADDSCRLARQFGSEPEQVFLFIDAFSPYGLLAIQVIGKPVAGDGDLRQHATFGFGPNIKLHASSEVLSGSIGPKKVPMLILDRLDLLNRSYSRSAVTPATPAQVAAITQFEVHIRARDVILQTGSFKAPMEALRTCTDDLVRSWGLDPVKQAKLRTPPVVQGEPGTWITSFDYPKGPLFWGQSAVVQFRLLVDAEGKATACHIQQATQGAEFSKLTCELLMKRARFKPAIGEDGQPTPSYYLNSVRWTA